MNGRIPAPRRRARSWRITAAIAVLWAATLIVVGAVATGDLVVVGCAAGAGLLGGWVALRLAWGAILQGRYEHAVDRTELAHAYRALFADRAVEQQAFVSAMSTRLADRESAVRALQGSLEAVELRAAEAESSVSTYRVRLRDAEGQVASMGDLITRNLVAQEAARQELARKRRLAESEAAASADADRPAGPLRRGGIPEWADLQADPVSALVAWEEHANQVAGRHTSDELPAKRA